jgi:hypothetical protein
MTLREPLRPFVKTRNECGLLKRLILDCRYRAASALAVLIVTAGTVHADVRVSGDVGAVQLDATRSDVAEVLSALESAFRLRVNTSIVLDKSIGGTYSGSLAQVLPRILQGYNYVIRSEPTEIEVTILARQGDHAAVVQRRHPPGKSPALSLSDAVRLKVH